MIIAVSIMVGSLVLIGTCQWLAFRTWDRNNAEFQQEMTKEIIDTFNNHTVAMESMVSLSATFLKVLGQNGDGIDAIKQNQCILNENQVNLMMKVDKFYATLPDMASKIDYIALQSGAVAYVVEGKTRHGSN